MWGKKNKKQKPGSTGRKTSKRLIKLHDKCLWFIGDMKEIDLLAFTVELGEFYKKADTSKSGTVLVTMKRMTEQRIRKREKLAKGKEDVIMTEASADDAEYPCLVRASFKKNKISTVVSPAEFEKFQDLYSTMIRAYVNSLKKKDRKKNKTKAKAE